MRDVFAGIGVGTLVGLAKTLFKTSIVLTIKATPNTVRIVDESRSTTVSVAIARHLTKLPTFTKELTVNVSAPFSGVFHVFVDTTCLLPGFSSRKEPSEIAKRYVDKGDYLVLSAKAGDTILNMNFGLSHFTVANSEAVTKAKKELAKIEKALR